MMTPNSWYELATDLSKAKTLKEKEDIIADAFIDGKIDVNLYRALHNQLYATPTKSVFIEFDDFRGFPAIKEKKCDCGAKHTSFPQHHLHWCSAK